MPRALLEIKSSERVTEDDLRHLVSLGKDYKYKELFCLSRDPSAKVIKNVKALPWQEGLKELGL